MAHRNDQVDISVFFVGKRLWECPVLYGSKITFCKNRLPEFFSTGLDGILYLSCCVRRFYHHNVIGRKIFRDGIRICIRSQTDW